MKSFLTLVIVIYCIPFAIGQADEIDSKCADYDTLIARDVRDGMDVVPKITVNATLIKRAIGPVKHDIVMYFDEYEVMNESDFPHQKRATLRKVKFDINAGSYAIRYQYYFNPKGHLIKYNEVEVGYECIIRDIYFQKNKAIRVKLAPTNKGCLPEDMVKGYDRTDLSEKDKNHAQLAQKEAQKFKELLRQHYALICD